MKIIIDNNENHKKTISEMSECIKVMRIFGRLMILKTDVYIIFLWFWDEMWPGHDCVIYSENRV